MPGSSLMFEPIEGGPGIYHCCICGANPATLECKGTHNGPCCLQCAFSMLAELAEHTLNNNVKRAG